MVLADVVAEVVDACSAQLAFWEVGVGRCGCESVEVGASEHVGFADDAGGDCNGRDGDVEFCVGGGEEEFFEEAAFRGNWRRALGFRRGGFFRDLRENI